MKQLPLFLSLLLFYSCVPPASTVSVAAVVYDNQDYSPNVGMVRLYPVPLTTGFPNPIIPLGSTLRLEFDLLEEDFQYLHLKLRHCNGDWSPSPLQDLEYLTDYNDFPVNNYEFSQSAYLPYVNYRIDVPAVRISGNYILIIADDRGSPILTRKFMVFERKAAIDAGVVRSTGVAERNTHHQLEFDVQYSRINLTDPNRDLMAVILQNHNWNLAINDLKPTSIRIDRGLLEYRHFSQENTIPGWNEFRFFDTRSLAFRGQQVESIGLDANVPMAILQPQSSRQGLAYSEPFEPDLNGNFILENRDPNEGDIQSEYVKTTFTLSSDNPDLNVYVGGKFNNWMLTAANRLQYFPTNGVYQGNVLLKQGFYNYLFYVDSPQWEHYFIEGSHFQTVNEYEILLYFREQGKVFDRLIGYHRLVNN